MNTEQEHWKPDVEIEHEIDPKLIEDASRIIDDYLQDSEEPRFEEVLSLISEENDLSDTPMEVKEIITAKIREIYEQKLTEK